MSENITEYVLAKTDDLISIADAVRLAGGTETYNIAQLPSAISGLKSNNNIPTYHFVEAGKLINTIYNFKTEHPNSLIFGAVSDMHVYNASADYEEQTKNAIKNASFALEFVGAAAQCDFIINLGDLCWENGLDTDNAYAGAQYAADSLESAFERVPHFSIPGNHDKTDDTLKQYNLIGINNTFDTYSSTLIRGFGYKDYIDKKVRVICLNTNDYLNASGGCAIIYKQ